ncbi:MAG: cob(I)yrinic acid a,c-diamide adenosyltransferase [Anaerovibrio sp.]|uniref:cob(I)yrinic acid a,c-diamide adenosyltransferase n=1 Tax=Anaerovibrio sp. TaxID=1872532 RepID=UPI0025FD58CF|nr:cob(I)yrinic acid a,c-diamide adenosyltransferase [Anaerovibrio sp.]MCR5177080.1 cob(I)yrinic acid a,c-diamide adenosyltransferase [Anaerovibrio sp.]
MLQVYTGKGKGKTTAAIGLAIRSLGAGHKVFFLQFMKSLAYSEQTILQSFAPQLILRTTGKPFFIAEEGMLSDQELKRWGNDVVIFPPGKPPADYIKVIRDGFLSAQEEIIRTQPDLLILDEVNVALFFKLLQPADVMELLDALPQTTEVVCTGRNAPQWLVASADLVTDMQEIKHYYQKGIQARKGIEN